MKVLFVSQYSDPQLVGGNNNVYRQASALKHSLGVDVEILTWPEGDNWSGPSPAAASSLGPPYVKWCYEGVNYHVVKLPMTMLDRVQSDVDWERAVETGCELLEKIRPAIVHLQHWRGLWWILESANRLSIPTVYTAHDWGMGCLRTILVKGEGGLCDGTVETNKCIECIWNGRNPVGKANELLVSTPIGERFMGLLKQSVLDQWLERHGAVRLGLRKRVTANTERAKTVFQGLGALIVANSFAKGFFRQFGVPEERIHLEPWYYDLDRPLGVETINRQKTVFGFIGRIAPEKGLKRIFEALSEDSIDKPVHLLIAGAIEGEYARRLHSRYRHNVGKHSVEWMGWIPHQEVGSFYEKVDVVIISSEWMDNTPLTLIECFAFKKPVVITDIPSVREFVKEGRTGYLTSFGSTQSLAQAINRANLRPGDLCEMKANIPAMRSSVNYARAVKAIYESVDSRGMPYET